MWRFRRAFRKHSFSTDLWRLTGLALPLTRSKAISCRWRSSTTPCGTAPSEAEAGDRVHVETDVIGKYVERLVAPYLNHNRLTGGQGI